MMATAHFLDKTLAAAAEAGEQAIFSERYARRKGLLQSIDARVKIATLLLLIITASLIRTFIPLGMLLLVGVSLAYLSSVPATYFLKRVWLVVPAFTALLALPAVLNVVTPGEPLWVLMRLPDAYLWGPYAIPQDIAVTRQGLRGAAILVLRVSTSVSFAVLLMLTTRWSDILAALRALFVPRVFVMTLSMTYRYLFVFLRLVQDMYRARKSRTVHRRSSSSERSWVASRIGFLYLKSAEMSADVYRAMLSRGYHGEIIGLTRFRTRSGDWLWTLSVAVFCGLLLAMERKLLR